ncbi:MAG: hypothetical protein ACLQBQ_05295 [Smithella sp.]
MIPGFIMRSPVPTSTDGCSLDIRYRKSMCSLACIWLIFILFITVSYPDRTIAAEVSCPPTKQSSGKETISGAFGIKFGEDIRNCLEGHNTRDRMTLEGFSFNYMILKPPANIKGMFPDAQSIKLSGIADDDNRIIVIQLDGIVKEPTCDENDGVQEIKEVLREKYKIIKPQKNGIEEYGDSEGSRILMECNGGSFFTIKYTSHLMSNYIARLKVNRQQYKDELKDFFRKIM